MPPTIAPAWETVLHQWMVDYRPQSATDRQTVLRAAHADWLLRAEQCQYQEIASGLLRQYGPAAAWTDAQHRRLELFGRSLHQAQNSFLRWQRAAEQFRRARLIETLRLEAQQARRQASRTPSTQGVVEKPTSTYRHEPAPFVQYIEAFTEEGVTVTVCNPPHQNLLNAFETAFQSEKQVRRTLRVLLPVPPEYAWLTVPDGEDCRAITWSSTVEQCRPDLLRDLAGGNGHVLPSPHMPINKQPQET